MSVRKRTWKTAAGEECQAWLCDYTGHVKTFARKKDADASNAKAKVEVREVLAKSWTRAAPYELTY
jgi:integrase